MSAEQYGIPSDDDLMAFMEGDPSKPEPIPDEAMETLARQLRAMYLALTRQNFSEHQALSIVGDVVTGAMLS